MPRTPTRPPSLLRSFGERPPPFRGRILWHFFRTRDGGRDVRAARDPEVRSPRHASVAASAPAEARGVLPAEPAHPWVRRSAVRTGAPAPAEARRSAAPHGVRTAVRAPVAGTPHSAAPRDAQIAAHGHPPVLYPAAADAVRNAGQARTAGVETHWATVPSPAAKEHGSCLAACDAAWRHRLASHCHRAQRHATAGRCAVRA